MCGEASITSINPAHFICLDDTISRMKLALHTNYSTDYKLPGTRCSGEDCAQPVRTNSCPHLLEGTLLVHCYFLNSPVKMNCIYYFYITDVPAEEKTKLKQNKNPQPIHKNNQRSE